MDLRRTAALLAIVASAALCARTAIAANDAAALKLREQAIYTDYLATNFAAAEKKLERAISMCGGNDCAPALRARLRCDLGAIYFTDQKPDAARGLFADALKDDPSVAIDKDLSTPDVERAFAASKGTGASTAPATAPAVASDLKHTPPARQAILTPVPIYAELPEGIDVSKVYVRYKAFGAPKWKTANMEKIGAGWGTEIPCADVGDTPGDLKYFIQATDAEGDLIATSGRLVAPHVVPIVTKLDGDAPHLPGRAPPARCASVGDCPPEFPGCHAKSDTQAACVSDEECAPGQACKGGVCESGGGATVAPAAEEEGAPRANWVSVALQQDFVLLPSQSDACAGGTGYTCFDSGGNYYSAAPLAQADDQVNGGIVPATARVLAGYDRAISRHVTLGARLGFAFGGGPQRPAADAFLPLHAEGRATLWFGHDPLARAGIRFFALAAGGVAQVDASVPVNTYDSMASYQKGNAVPYQAWKKTGTGFAAIGGGAMYAFTPSSGLALEARAMEMFPTAGTGMGVQLGYVVGL